jgi:NADH-quinone oxidoreductase subunit E
MPDAPELADVSAAVAAAQSAVEQVLAQSGIDPATGQGGKPEGLAQPRPSGKDDLRRIEGLSPLDIATLNNLGVYHFDQIAAWDEAAILWMENHVFARGRIGREAWQEQARLLSVLAAR